MSWMTELVARAKETEKAKTVAEPNPRAKRPDKDYSDMVASETDPNKKANLKRQLDAAGLPYTEKAPTVKPEDPRRLKAEPVKRTDSGISTGTVSGSGPTIGGIVKKPETDYDRFLKSQAEAKTIASLYQPASGFDSNKGMYGGLTPTYEAYVADGIGMGNQVMSRAMWQKAQDEKAAAEAASRQREPREERTLSSILPTLPGVTTPIVTPPTINPTPVIPTAPIVPTLPKPADAVTVIPNTTPVYSVAENVDLTQLVNTIRDTNISPEMWKRIVEMYPALKPLYAELRS